MGLGNKVMSIAKYIDISAMTVVYVKCKDDRNTGGLGNTDYTDDVVEQGLHVFIDAVGGTQIKRMIRIYADQSL